ncbi:MAG: hypothetical protein F7C82_05775 [Desulfurococcales archaeon]|nr:hypothetical protein [Desulfurococcales archaeon]MCE4622787.1 hypothetical protein [Desulfurococcales archaeon]MCE4629769.1 hypothetical protein [Desulfurococcales archaeon]
MRLLKRGKAEAEVSIHLDDDINNLLQYYMMSTKNEDLENTIKDLIRKGYNYWLLEKKYGDKIDSLEVWDRNLQCMKIESGFLYYRMRVREVIEELKNAILILSGVLADLESCYKMCNARNIDIDKIRRYRGELSRYMNDYIKPLKEEVNSNDDISVEKILENVEKILEMYKGKRLDN